MIEPLRLSFTVRCPAAQAFEVWTRRIGQWWPLDHTVSGARGLEVVLEGQPGGRIFERTPSGIEHDWGVITRWEPPRRLGYTWHLRQDRADATQVEITFADQGDGTTRVEIEHHGWERLGAHGPGRRDATAAGWHGLLPHFLTLAEAASGSEAQGA